MSTTIRSSTSAANLPQPARNKLAVLVYYGINPRHAGGGECVDASDRMIREIRKLAPKTRGTGVAFFAQGYEKSDSGKWEMHRYFVSHGKAVRQEVSQKGSLFSPSTFRNFLASAPRAKKTVVIFGAHGRGFPGFAGESVVNGKMKNDAFDEMPLKDFAGSFRASGVRPDLLDLDTCFGGQWEVLSTLHRVSPHIVASSEATFLFPTSCDPSAQALVPAFEKILKSPEISGKKLGSLLIKNAQANQTDFGLLPDSYTPTLALYSAKRIPDLDPLIGRLGEALASALERRKTRKLLLKAAEKSFAYETSDFKDLKSFIRNLKKYGVLARCGASDTGKKILRALKQSCETSFRKDGYEKTGPLSIFVPSGPKEKELKEWLSSLTKTNGGDVQKAKARMLESFSTQAEQISRQYLALSRIPEGWKIFAKKLLHLLKTRTIPEKIKRLE